MAEFPPPAEDIVLAHFIVSDDVERSRRFYTEVLGGEDLGLSSAGRESARKLAIEIGRDAIVVVDPAEAQSLVGKA